MIRVNYVSALGEVVTVDVAEGDSVMQGALNNSVEGIDAECGGACSCGTCHCYVDEKWLASLSPRSSEEDDMLDCVSGLKPNSRLSCQLKLDASHDGLVVRLPESQSF